MEAVSAIGAFLLHSKFDIKLSDTQQSFDSFLVSMADKAYVRKIPLLLFGLLGENVAFVSVLSLDRSRSGKLETLFCTGVGLCL